MRHDGERDLPRLRDMLQHGRVAIEFVRGKAYAEYETDLIERKVEIGGEASRHISPELQLAHPEVPWRIIAAQRHILAHDYGEIIQERIWRVATRYLSELLSMVEKIVAELSS